MPDQTESRPQSLAPPILETRQLRRRVNDAVLVTNVSISVTKGEVIAIVGPSGAGKSSLLRLLNRLDEPSEGEVFIEGQDYREIEPRALRRRVGMLMQLPNLFPGTVSDNIRFGPQQRGKDLAAEEIKMLLEGVSLDDFEDRDVEQLSGGEAQRVALARTLANNPDILLLDEPTSALDDNSKTEVERLLVEIIQQRELTCLWVTHDLDQARRMTTRILHMKNAKIIRTEITEKEEHHA